jgi:hypothetical protein
MVRVPDVEFEHPAIDQLAATPEILRLLMAQLSDEDALWIPGRGRWSVAEILAHLSHVEAHYFRAGVQAMIERNDPEVEPYETPEWEENGTYRDRDPEESFAHWEEQREDNVGFLRGLDTAALRRTGRHPAVGAVTVGNYLNEWALHDLGHVRQIAEIVRARLYLPNIGPFQAQYKVSP